MFYVSAKYEKLSNVFSASICSWDVVETLRSKDSIKLYAAKLRKECKESDFVLDASYWDEM